MFENKVKLKDKHDLNIKYHIEKPPAGNRVSAFLDIFSAILKHSNYRAMMDQYSKMALKCAECNTECHVYISTGNPKDIPCARTELILNIYRRYFTLEGSLWARIAGGFELTESHIDEMSQSFWRCNACRKCLAECPGGIDHGLITHLARYVLAEMGIVPKNLAVSSREQLEGVAHNSSKIPFVALKDSLEFLEEELFEQFEAEIKFPIDVQNAEYLFFSPVSDYLMEAETLMGIAAAMHQGGVSWTIGAQYFEGINYGLFYSDLVLGRVVEKIAEEMKRLNCKKILVGECGHASRAAKFIKNYWQGDDCPEVVQVLQLTSQLIKEGKIKFDKSKAEGKYTYHDPCNYARMGWVIEEPRHIINSMLNDFVEMTPNKNMNFCCGGGGGTAAVDESREFRTTVAGKVKAEQIKLTGADYIIAPCANCKKQIRETLEDNKMSVELIGLHDVLLKTIIIDKNENSKVNKQDL